MSEDVTNQFLADKIADLSTKLDECHRAIKGVNGTPGIAGRLTTLETMFQRFISNDFPHMQAELIEKINEAKKIAKDEDETEGEKLRLERQVLMKETVSWKPIVSQFILPIIVAVITALLISGVVDRVLASR